MINGFEETKPLTTTEFSMLPLFVKGLSTKIGEANAITNDQMIKALAAKSFYLTPARVRKIINHIRVKKLLKNLVATSNGYYIENDTEKLNTYIESLRQRADAILAVANSYK